MFNSTDIGPADSTLPRPSAPRIIRHQEETETKNRRLEGQRSSLVNLIDKERKWQEGRTTLPLEETLVSERLRPKIDCAKDRQIERYKEGCVYYLIKPLL